MMESSRRPTRWIYRSANGSLSIAVLIRQGVEVVQQGDALLIVTGASIDTTAN